MMFTDNSRGRSIAKDPAVVWFQGRYYLYYSVSPEPGGETGIEGWGIGIAASDDMEHWTKLGDLKREGEVEKNGMCAPGAIVLDDVIHLFYQSYGNWTRDAICHATSTDGVNFRRNPENPIFRPTGDWNNGRAIDADVIVIDREIFLYFATRDPAGEVQMLGVATAPVDRGFGPDTWTQRGSGPILKPELDWEMTCIEAPAAMLHNGVVYLFYAGAYNNCPQQVGLATSTDGIHFTRTSDKPFLTNGKAGEWNESESGHPYVFVEDDGSCSLFYQGNNDNGVSWYLSRQILTLNENGPSL